ncbi:MAG: beta-ketoacyl-ACP synthase III [Gammaproteobacteria bacterium]|jgi:beta-ketodecanoyl-[acyl-carrier-protein] synthase
MPSGVVISGTGLYVPAESIGNEELVAAYNHYVDRFRESNAEAIARGEVTPPEKSSPEFIENASGIRHRYVYTRDGVLDPERMWPRFPQRGEDDLSITAEIAVAAAREALDAAGLDGSDIDAVILSCSNLERPYPALAIEVQHAIGAGGFAYDMNVACSSATFGIQNAADAIARGSARRVLMVNPEITSAHINWRSRDAHFIFGDVCTAVVLERAEASRAAERWHVLGTKLATRYSNNIRNDFGFLNRGPEADFFDDAKLFRQQGRKVFKEVSPLAADHIREHLDESDIGVTAVRRYWLHQANLNMNRLVAKRLLGRDAGTDEAPVVLDEFANTASAGSVIAFHRHRGDLASGDIGVICSFGAGYSIGSVIVQRQ